jgi:hypothetical protein
MANYNERAAFIGSGGSAPAANLVGYVFQAGSFSGAATFPGTLYYGILAKGPSFAGVAAWAVPQGGGKQHVFHGFSAVGSVQPAERARYPAAAAYSGGGGLSPANDGTLAVAAAFSGIGASAAVNTVPVANQNAATFSGASSLPGPYYGILAPSQILFGGAGGLVAAGAIPSGSSASFSGAAAAATANATLLGASAGFSSAAVVAAANAGASALASAFAGSARLWALNPPSTGSNSVAFSAAGGIVWLGVPSLAGAAAAFSGAAATAAANSASPSVGSAAYAGAGTATWFDPYPGAQSAAFGGVGTLYGPHYGIVSACPTVFSGGGSLGGSPAGPWRDQPAFSGTSGWTVVPGGGTQHVTHAFGGAGGLASANTAGAAGASAAFSGALVLVSANEAPASAAVAAFSSAAALGGLDQYDIYNSAPTLFGGGGSYAVAEIVTHHFGNLWQEAAAFSGISALGLTTTAALLDTPVFSGAAALLPAEAARIPAAALYSAGAGLAPVYVSGVAARAAYAGVAALAWANTAAVPGSNAGAFSAVGSASSADTTWAATAGGFAASAALASASVLAGAWAAAFAGAAMLSPAPRQLLAQASGAFAGTGALPVSERTGGIQFEASAFAGTAAWAVPMGAGTQHIVHAFSASAALQSPNLATLRARLGFSGVCALQPAPQALLPAIGTFGAAAAAGWPNDYLLGLASAFSAATTISAATPRQWAAAFAALSGAGTMAPANTARIARAATSFATTGSLGANLNPWAYPNTVAFSGAAALGAPPTMLAASFSALGAVARFAAPTTTQTMQSAAAHSGAGGLRSDYVARLASGAALAGATAVTAYSNLRIASAAACFTLRGEWALREGYVAVPHENRGSWVANGLFAAASIQHSQVHPAYYPVGHGRLLVGSRPTRIIRRVI